MKNQIFVIAAFTLALSACGNEAEKTVETGKAIVETGKSVVESGEKVVEQAKEVMAPITEETTAGADGQSLYGACAGCHGGDGMQKALGASPAIAGQSTADLVMKIKGYKDGSYGGPMKASMAPMVANLNDDQIAAVAEYIAGL